jgi:hypothetical protein
MTPEPPPSEHGAKVAFGQMLSKHLRRIGLEQTECSDLDPNTGKARMMSKAEALARVTWKLALGYADGDGKYHEPNPKFVDIVYDRLEGKVATDKDAIPKKQPLSKKVDDQAKKRLNSMAEEGDGV